MWPLPREQIITARGERAKEGGNRMPDHPVTVTGWSEKTTDDLAEEAGMSAPTYKRRNAVGKKMHEKVSRVAMRPSQGW
jgi:hypothetical protein